MNVVFLGINIDLIFMRHYVDDIYALPEMYLNEKLTGTRVTDIERKTLQSIT